MSIFPSQTVVYVEFARGFFQQFDTVSGDFLFGEQNGFGEKGRVGTFVPQNAALRIGQIMILGASIARRLQKRRPFLSGLNRE